MAPKKTKIKPQAEDTREVAIAKLIPLAAGAATFDLQVRRGGNANSRDVLINGKIRLDWNGDDSIPISLPAGTYMLHCVILGNQGQTYAFTVEAPHHQNLGAGVLTALGAQVFDRKVIIP